jgi:hypothetical protein
MTADIEAIRKRHQALQHKLDAWISQALPDVPLAVEAPCTINDAGDAHSDRAALLATLDAMTAPIDMVLFCPKCGYQHIDEPSPDWSNPPHRTHMCLNCDYLWRPADVPTNGVKAIKTKGKADSPPVKNPQAKE